MDFQNPPSPAPLPDYANLITSPLAVFLIVDLIGSIFIPVYFFYSRRMDESQAPEATDTELGIPRYPPQNSGSSHHVITHVVEKISEENLMEASQSSVHDEKRGDEGVAKCSECAICLEDVKEGDLCRVLPPCKHTFHKSCIGFWLDRKKSCPICRSSVEATNGS